MADLDVKQLREDLAKWAAEQTDPEVLRLINRIGRFLSMPPKSREVSFNRRDLAATIAELQKLLEAANGT